MSKGKEGFFNQNNEAMLQRVLYNDICRRIGGDLNERQATRLIKTVSHYMGEVYRVKGDGAPVAQLNTEVLKVVLPDYMMYMERSARSSGRSVVGDIEEGPSQQPVQQGPMRAIEDASLTSGPRQQMDVSTAFSQLQATRQGQNKAKMPEPTDFRISLQDEGPVPIDVFEKIKQDREAEARRTEARFAQQANASSGSAGAGMNTFVEASDTFGRERRRLQDEAELAFAEQERKALEARASANSQLMPVPPDMRQIFMGDRETLDRTFNRVVDRPQNYQALATATNGAAGNATTALPTALRDASPSGQQMIITREPSTMAYKENELNLFVYSGDRDWISNSSETRYNFSVSFDPANMPVGLRLNPTSTVKFKNIVRLELVKAIMPGESVESLVTKSIQTAVFTANTATNTTLTVTSVSSGTIQIGMAITGSGITAGTTISAYGTGTGGAGTYTLSAASTATATGVSMSGSITLYDSPYNFNILSFPYIQVRIPELDNNVYGTNQGLNAAFGVLQYDANWIYDTTNASARGYFAMIPKFLKCQKVYQPTPLATLQKLTFRFERPDGTLVSTIPDTVDITQIYSSKQVTATTAFPYGYDATTELNTGSAYYFIKTTTYFNALTVAKGDRIVIKNLTWSATPTGAATAQIQDFIPFIQGDSGFLVVDVGFGTAPAAGGTANITIGANAQGYCNYIVVRGKWSDPTTGAIATAQLGNAADASVPASLADLTSFLNTNATATGRLLNQSHQVQVALRVITREMDPTAILRPDNL